MNRKRKIVGAGIVVVTLLCAVYAGAVLLSYYGRVDDAQVELDAMYVYNDTGLEQEINLENAVILSLIHI